MTPGGGLRRRSVLAAAAIPGLWRPAAAQHAGAAEWAQLQQQLQAGAYRRALTLASHIAGGHPEVAAGGALYAWLLHAGGQARFAQRVLADSLARRPGDALLERVRDQLQTAWPRADASMRAAGLAPQATGVLADADTGVAGSALLSADGRSAFAPAALLEGRGAWGVRDGLGRTVRAERLREAAAGCVELRLHPALPPPPVFGVAPRPPFAGSPAVSVEYAPADDAAAAWPWLRGGFLGRAGRLDLDLPPGPRGGPVLGLGGQLLGIALSAPDGQDRLLPAAEFLPPSDAPGPVARLPQDALYEGALRWALQLLVAPA